MPTADSPKLVLGPPGCGKTHTMIEIVRDALDRGIAPEDIGFFSYTRKAVEEAAERAGREFNLTHRELIFFKTLHALGFSQLGLNREDVMSYGDWKAFGKELGLEVTGGAKTNDNDGLLIGQGQTYGDKHLQALMRAKMRCVSLDQEVRESEDYDLSWPVLRKMEQLLEVYRHQLGKMTFLDMLEQYLVLGEVPRLRLLIVDEAQDLVPLQWKVVEKLMTRADEVVFAGDDDQAIHRWAGVDVSQFLQCSDRREVLTQSFRLPRSVFELSQRIVSRIHHRLPKDYSPTDEEGSVQYHMERWELPIDEGSWTLMARTNALVNDWAEELMQDGYLFSVAGRRSIPEEVTSAIRTWQALQDGGEVTVDAVKQMYDQMPRKRRDDPVAQNGKKLLDAADPTRGYRYQDLVQNFGLRAAPTSDALDLLKMNDREKTYLRSLERRGEDIAAEPRIKLSTIHRMKGGEDENIGLYLGSTRAAAETRHPDDEHRVFYVGATRARQNLHIVESGRAYRYDL